MPQLLILDRRSEAPAPAYSVTISSAHMCCGSCVKGAAAAGQDIAGVTAVGDTKRR